MRRAIALLLMILVPLQYTWAVASLHEHPDEAAAGEFLHIGSHGLAAGAGAGDQGAASQADGDHGSHCHHVPSLLLLPDCGLPAGVGPAAGPAAAPLGAHASHIPPVSDRPPRGRA